MMDRIDWSFVYRNLFEECLKTRSLRLGKLVHSHMLKTGFSPEIFLCNKLMDMYSKCMPMGLREARKVFNRMPERDVFSWNNLINSCVKGGDLEQARQVFEEMPVRDRVSWNSIITACSRLGRESEAIARFAHMRSHGIDPNQFTLSIVLRCCSSLRSLDRGRQVHSASIKFGLAADMFVCGALVDFYSKCRDVAHARQVFDKMPQRNLVSWNAMISGFSQNGLGDETLSLFYEMRVQGIVPDNSTFACVLTACSRTTALELGKQLHGSIFRHGYEGNVFVGSALIDLYGKCGSIIEAKQVFDQMPVRNLVTWNSIILAYSQSGEGKKALHFFDEMLKQGVIPDKITFIGVLAACSHCGMVELGHLYLNSMINDYNIEPEMEHYSCMIDLLARTGHLVEAEKLIENIPMKPDAAIWGSLLGASRVYGNARLGEKAASYLFQLEPENPSPYLLLSHLYAEKGEWDSAATMRKLMKEKGLKKEPGCSWTEIKNKVHTFVADDMRHPQATEIFELLQALTKQMELEGIVPSRNLTVRTDDSVQMKQHSYHSEQLVIALVLINTPSEVAIRVFKNLRICSDCHRFMEFVSKATKRKIILRDIRRYHHFENGTCSCGGFW